MAALSAGAVFLAVLVSLLGLGVVTGLLWLLWRVFKGLLRVLGHALGFVKREAIDGVHTLGALVTAFATVPLMAVNFAILRLSAGKHYGRAFVDEIKGVGAGLWRVALGNPLRFLGLGGVVDGVEGRLSSVIERAPRRAGRATFDGYEVIGTLPSGGSGAQLFIARPRNKTVQRFLQAGRGLPGEVVIKSFALERGSTLPQIVRESRALEAASALGLVCEHHLTNDHFYYVMPYVKGEDLERVTRALHARGTPEGLADPELQLALGYSIDLLDSLQRFHSGGLWHKDVKPTNIIVAKGRGHLVDFGLVTPLASAMTLTTHGTEYYRDPEMVRLAMQGVKVHEVDGVRFDIYSAGAVLYALLENSFPAHGNLSRLSKRAPEALRWIVQRAMAEMSSRYGAAAEMRADLAALAAAADPFEVRPADLPSFRQAGEPTPEVAAPFFGRPSAGEPTAAPEPAFQPAPVSLRPRRRRLVPAMALAAVAFFGLTTMAGAGFLFAGHSRANARGFSSATRTVSSERPARRLSRLSERDRHAVELAQVVVEEQGYTNAYGPGEAHGAEVDEIGALLVLGESAPEVQTSESYPCAQEDPEPEEEEHEAVLPPGRILVIDDLTTQVDSRVLMLLRTRLAERGFAVVGQEKSEEDASDAVELLANARHTIGLGQAEEAETQARLQRFLDQAIDLDSLILVSRSEDESEHLYRVFVKGAASASGPR